MQFSSAKQKILIVEDHPLFRAMLARLIEQEPALTVCGQADNVQAALILIAQTQPDAAIVDLSLLESSGLDLIKDLKARNLPLPVLVLSMHAERLCVEQALSAGARGYVSKEEPPAIVLEALRTVLAGGRYLSERVTKTISNSALSPV
jgi:DNA-binding NarL/FixJ family response regulator